MNQRQNPKAIDRTEMRDVSGAIKRGWDVPQEKLADVAQRCQLLIDDPEAYQRDKDKAAECLQVVRKAIGGDNGK